jgi:hypothetical protein
MNVRRQTCDHPFVLELLEREDQLDSLHRLFDQAEAGSGHLVFLGAEAGAGKTALVQAFGDSVASRARVLTGWCDPLSAPRPAGPLIDMAHGLGDPVRAILGAEGRTGLFDAMFTDLASYLRPTVLVFEDVHWADDTTLDLLRFLGRRASASRALLIATYRDDEVGPDHPLRTRLGDLAQRSFELRESLRTIEKTPRAAALQQKLLDRLGEATKETEELSRNLSEDGAALGEARAQLTEGLRELVIEEETAKGKP